MILLYGNENMGKVLNHLQAEKLPVEYITAMSTNSAELKKHILSGETVETLEKFVKDRIPKDEKFNSIEKIVAKGMADFETVILNQGEGSKLKTDYLLSIQAAVYKSALQRVKEGESINEATDNAVKSFTKDYFISPDKTFMIPVDVGGKFVNQPIVYDKSQALKLMVEDTDYLTRFHGEDGYMHYATLAGVDNLSEEEVKKRMEFTIKNHSKWLMNGDGTGIVLYAEFTTGTKPVVNADGKKIEFFFVDTPNDKGILSIELKAPVTGEDIDLIPFTSDVGAYEFEETNYDNTSENKNRLTTAIDSVGRVIDTAGDVLISSAAASEIDSSWRNNTEIQKIIKEDPIIEKIIMTESSGDPNALNKRTGAKGLMQIMKNTAEKDAGFGVNYNLDYEELSDPVKNVKYGAAYFKGLKKYFGNNRDALIAYNWGAGNTKKWLKKGGNFKKLPKETRDYVEKILGVND